MKDKRVLIVDDEPNIVMSLEYAFKKQGYTVFIARDGAEALEIAKDKQPHAILLDIMMPQMDGYQALQAIRAMEELKDTKVIFLSAKSKATDIEKGLSMGVDQYLTKPFSMKKVVQEVGSLLVQE